MKIWTFSLCRNEAAMIPFFLRHYGSFVDQINVWDDKSDDGSRELLAAHPKVKLYDWPLDTGIDEDAFLAFAYKTYPTAVGQANWCIWCDIDEMVYHPDIKGVLEQCNGYDVLRTNGFNMVNNGIPQDDGRQIWEIAPNGVSAPVYGKPIIFKPNAFIRWNRGKHDIEGGTCKICPSIKIKLLHYRYMGYDYTKYKNAKNYARCGLKSGDKGAAWSCSPDYKGEHSADWARMIVPLAKNVVKP